MKLPLLALTLFLSVFYCHAQEAHHIGFSPGVSFVRVSGDDNLQQQGLGQGFFLRGTFTWDMKQKWLEGGGGIEVGKMSGKVETRDTFTNIFGQVHKRWSESWEEFASPYANVYMLTNVKWILGEGKYLYGGGVTGMMVARSGLLYRETAVNWYLGLTGGMVFYIDDITGLDLGLGWRRTKLTGTGYDGSNDLQPALRELMVESFALKYVTLSFGLVVHFE
ncbi:MAG: hypothetical protein H6551_13610 [Chitinophagales bacterium]|nr:hypothetical protein [Chitinophagaceae bacterium]MCB9066171.1 hypothetical protein [Chitinophagales bacterium]